MCSYCALDLSNQPVSLCVVLIYGCNPLVLVWTWSLVWKWNAYSFLIPLHLKKKNLNRLLCWHIIFLLSPSNSESPNQSTYLKVITILELMPYFFNALHKKHNRNLFYPLNFRTSSMSSICSRINLITFHQFFMLPRSIESWFNNYNKNKKERLFGSEIGFYHWYSALTQGLA